jgi:uncharacterized SAM-binding protein YcdF (DUF218 family)
VQALVDLAKASLIPGTLTFLLYGLTIGILVAYGPRRLRPAALPLLLTLASFYWLGSVPAVADALATRFHARSASPVTLDDVAGAKAIVVLGAGLRTSYIVNGRTIAIPDPQTVYNAAEAARIYHLIPGGLPVIASGGRQSRDEQLESLVMKEWLVAGGVPPERLILESESRNTREQARFVAPILKANHWERFVLVTPAVQGPRARAVFRRQGIEPVSAAAPFSSDTQPAAARWLPALGALRVTERATYDYLAWAYYWIRGWLG